MHITFFCCLIHFQSLFDFSAMNNGTIKTLNVNYCLMSAKQKNAYYCSKASFWTYNIGDNVCDFSFFFDQYRFKCSKKFWVYLFLINYGKFVI